MRILSNRQSGSAFGVEVQGRLVFISEAELETVAPREPGPGSGYAVGDDVEVGDPPRAVHATIARMARLVDDLDRDHPGRGRGGGQGGGGS